MSGQRNDIKHIHVYKLTEGRFNVERFLLTTDTSFKDCHVISRCHIGYWCLRFYCQ